jgi:hypothetical protein
MKKIFFYTFGHFLLLAGAILIIACSTSRPPNIQVEDAKITAQVKSKLASEVRPSSLVNIAVNTTNHVVTLAGQVENDEVKQKAEMVAHAVPGVASVNNNLQVQEELKNSHQEEQSHRSPQG